MQEPFGCDKGFYIHLLEVSVKTIPLILSIISGICFIFSFNSPFVCSDFGVGKVKHIDTASQIMEQPCDLIEKKLRENNYTKIALLAISRTQFAEACSLAMEEPIKALVTNTTDGMLGDVTHPITKRKFGWYECIHDVAPNFNAHKLGTCVSAEKTPFQTCTKWWMVAEAGIPIGTQTIVGVIEGLFTSNDVFLGFLIVIFSILFPILKISLSIFLCLQKRISKSSLKLLTLTSKWSMTDVFVVALLITFFKAESFNFHFQAEYGVYLFALAAILSSFSVMMIEQQQVKKEQLSQKSS